MSIKCYRIRIEGFLTDQDFGGSPEIEPDSWPLEEICKALTVDVSITATLLDEIKDAEEEEKEG
jgi:hypothetical protein